MVSADPVNCIANISKPKQRRISFPRVVLSHGVCLRFQVAALNLMKLALQHQGGVDGRQTGLRQA